MKEIIYIVIIMFVLSIGILLISPNRDQNEWYVDEYGVILTNQSAVSPFKQSTSRNQQNQYTDFDNKGLIDPLPESNIIGPISSININNRSELIQTQFTQNFVSTPKTYSTNKLESSGGGNSGLAYAWGKSGSQGQAASGNFTHLSAWNEGNRNHFTNNRQDNWPLLAPPFSDYIEDDITHPGGSPIIGVHVGEGYILLFSFGLLFLIGKIVFVSNPKIGSQKVKTKQYNENKSNDAKNSWWQNTNKTLILYRSLKRHRLY